MIELGKKTDLFIVAPYAWGSNKILFRRDRLARYFKQKPEINRIYWIHPEYSLLYLFQKSIKVNKIKSNVFSIGVPDYKGISHFSGFDKYKHLFSKAQPLIRGTKSTKKILIFTVPMYYKLISIYPWNKVVYDCSDHWTSTIIKSGPFSMKGKLIEKRRKQISKTEGHIIRSSNHIFCSSEFLLKRLLNKYGRNSRLIENGVDINAFKKVNLEKDRDLCKISSPKIGFIGGIKNKIDFKLLYEVAKATESYNYIIAGPISHPEPEEFKKMLGLKNVKYLGALDANEVPTLLSQIEVGLLPYKNIEYNYGITPLKLFEYLAAGLPTVGCGLPSTKKFIEDKVYYYSDLTVSDFIKNINLAINYSNEPKYEQRRKEIAIQNDWNHKFNTIFNCILSK